MESKVLKLINEIKVPKANITALESTISEITRIFKRL